MTVLHLVQLVLHHVKHFIVCADRDINCVIFWIVRDTAERLPWGRTTQFRCSAGARIERPEVLLGDKQNVPSVARSKVENRLSIYLNDRNDPGALAAEIDLAQRRFGVILVLTDSINALIIAGEGNVCCQTVRTEEAAEQCNQRAN